MPAVPRLALDHIVLLVPHAALADPLPSLAARFAISPGGRHADGLTENRLVVLRDGVYLELIAFVPGADPDARSRHKWGALSPGVADWALTSSSAADADAVLANTRAALDRARVRDAPVVATYPPAATPGGRVRPDGVELRWAVAFPEAAAATSPPPLARGQVPFFCFDVTERGLRVPPPSENDGVRHPSGATGVAALRVGVPRGRAAEFARTYAAIVTAGAGAVPVRAATEDVDVFRVGTPLGDDGGSCNIVLEPFDEDVARVLGLTLRTAQDGGEVGCVDEDFGGGNNKKKKKTKQALRDGDGNGNGDAFKVRTPLGDKADIVLELFAQVV
ncbi:glyoxalase-like domain-containing protein [Xylariaceae sp. FL0804]|nr:glyoxalase-like domain-containing protein [Xylariaceae sp. FL0804]